MLPIEFEFVVTWDVTNPYVLLLVTIRYYKLVNKESTETYLLELTPLRSQLKAL